MRPESVIWRQSARWDCCCRSFRRPAICSNLLSNGALQPRKPADLFPGMAGLWIVSTGFWSPLSLPLRSAFCGKVWMPRPLACCYGEPMNPVQPRPQPQAVKEPRSVTLLGATGSIGSSTVDLLKMEHGRYRVEAVTANRNAADLARLARELGARFAAVADPDMYAELKDG